MNAKQIKHYETLGAFFSNDMLNPTVVNRCFGELLKLDYALAEDLWEYMLIRNDADLKNPTIAELYIDGVYALFAKANGTRTAKTLTERAVIERAVFRFSPKVDGGELFSLVVNLLVSNKVDVVDGILKLVSQNDAMKSSFGKYMIKFLDKVFIEMTKKSASRRVELNRKQSALLTSVVQKVKGDERAMLVQRVKEVQ